jgi:hypothetical protein
MTDVFAVTRRFLLWLAGFLPALCMRWYYTERRLQTLFHVDVRPRGCQLLFDGGSLPHVELWLRATNFSTLPTTVDHVSVEVWGAGNTIHLKWDDRFTVAPASHKDFLVRDLQGVDLIPRLADCDRLDVRLTLKAHLRCRVRDFEKHEIDLYGVHMGLQNCSNELRARVRLP